MAKKDDNKHVRPFNFGEGPLVKQTEQTTASGFEAVEKKEQSGVVADGGTSAPAAKQTLEPVREITAPASQQQPSVYQEPMQNINIPIPTSQHMRLKIISAQSRQTMKDMVVQAIGLWLDVQEGKKAVKSPEL